MEYNTQQRTLPLPEYGRSVQNMVDHALTIEDRAERQRCANTIINIMGGMFPHLRDVPDFKHKLWDHLAIMADFKLDIDYPYEIVKKESLESVLVTYQDITREEKAKEQHYNLKMETVEMAQKVIDKQMMVAQEIAGLLGETTAETKVTLSKLRDSILFEEED